MNGKLKDNLTYNIGMQSDFKFADADDELSSDRFGKQKIGIEFQFDA